nr:tyrosine-type recombinase/integrase [Natronocella acetinitrilica]
MPTGRVLEEDRRERARWIFTFLRDAGARASEAVSHTMGSIQPDRESGGEFWTWQVRGKGDKEAQVPLAAQTMEALGAYRAHLGLPALPQPGERTPLICRLRGAGRMRQSLTRAALFRIVKDIFRDTATAVRAARPELAEQLESASTHWMRHTSITELAQATGDLRVVQRFGRHNDVRTSMRYIHTLDREVFAAVSRRAKALKQKS